MVVHVYSIMRNEMVLLPYYMKHYRPFVEKFFIFEDESSDGTVEYLKSFDNVTLMKPDRHGIDDRYFRQIYTDNYKIYSRGKADFVICCDGDEFIYHPDIVKKLTWCAKEGIKIVKPEGYTMCTEEFVPENRPITEMIKNGIRDVWYDKPILFNPEVNIRFDIGRHGMRHDFYNLEHTKIGIDTGIKLLHYRYLGKKYAEERLARGYSRMSERNLKWGLAKHMSPDSKYFHSAYWFEQNHLKAEKCIE